MKLYDYQLEAVYRMHNGCILCANVGRGKSITALSYYWVRQGGSPDYLTGKDRYALMSKPKDLYIITTARKRDTREWEDELLNFRLWSDRGLNDIYHNKVIIDSWNNLKKYVFVRNAFFIFDEQRAVGKGVWAKSFIAIAQQNEWILLSATPGDTWSDYIPVFLANGFYRNRTDFYNEHVVMSPYTKYPSIQRYVNVRRLIRLRDSILVDMRGENPAESIHEDIIVPYDIDRYKDIVRNRFNIWEQKPIENASEYCQCLRRVVYSDTRRQIALLELLEDHPKAIIFYNYNFELDILRAMFEPVEGLMVAEWNGHKHEEIPDGENWVYLVQYNAGAEGWNCIKTDTIIFYSQNYSYKIMTQAAGRIDRLNTPFQKLYYYHFKSRSGIDLAVSRALTQKKQFSEGKYYNQAIGGNKNVQTY